MKHAIPDLLYVLLKDMHRWEKSWRPRIGMPTRSAMLATGGGGYYEIEDWEDEIDSERLKLAAAAWRAIGPGDRILIEVEMGWLKPVAAVGRVTLAEAVERLERECRKRGLAV